MRFNSQNAREMAAKAHVAKRRNYRAAKEALKSQSLQRPPVSVLAAEVAGVDDYTLRRLARVRLQLDRLDAMIQTETDPQRLDRLASAQAKLAEQERQLAGRPLPGSLRPAGAPKRASIFDRKPASLASTPPAPPRTPTDGPAPSLMGRFEQE